MKKNTDALARKKAAKLRTKKEKGGKPPTDLSIRRKGNLYNNKNYSEMSYEESQSTIVPNLT